MVKRRSAVSTSSTASAADRMAERVWRDSDPAMWLEVYGGAADATR
jgi:hypothetical protein